MLRRFAGPRRMPDEDYVTWIRRSTRAAVIAAASAGVKCWVDAHLRAKWLWAGHVSRMGGYCKESWTFKTTFWRDAEWKRDYEPGGFLYSARPLRSRAGRWTRWEDEIVRAFAARSDGRWRGGAADKKAWNSMAEGCAAAVFK